MTFDTLFSAPANTARYYGLRPVEERLSTQRKNFSSLLSLMIAATLTLTPLVSNIAESSGHFVVRKHSTPDTNYELMNKEEISHALMKEGETFKAISVLIEDIKTSVYKDNDGGRTIGAGYSLSKNIAGKGRDRVVRELIMSGVSRANALVLTDKHSKHRDTPQITKRQAVRLLGVTQYEYEKTAAKWLGKKHYAALSKDQQAAVTYLAYNVGGTKLRKFRKLKSAITQDDHNGIKQNFVMKFMSKQGGIIQNHRAGNMLAAVFLKEKESSQKKTPTQLAMMTPL